MLKVYSIVHSHKTRYWLQVTAVMSPVLIRLQNVCQPGVRILLRVYKKLTMPIFAYKM